MYRGVGWRVPVAMKSVLMKIALVGILISASVMARANDEGSTVCCEDGERFVIENTLETSQAVPKESADLIIVELNRFRLTLYRNGEVFKRYPVAVGAPKTPSPVGEWKVIHKGGKWGGGFGDRWIGINVPWGIYGIHGTDKPGSIGSRSSHGCIRMYNRQVKELYSLIKVGTPVHIIGPLPKVALRKEYRRNHTGKDVVKIQFAMRAAGFDQGAADGRFGPAMEEAVKRMEKYYGLPMDGILGLDEQYILGLR